ncbi:MAG: 3-hydroxy-3-methylglutaryl-CoA reductase [Planctomycetota bacterium]|nr:3-hydroxy-3-methylglutaryl-CoA reductase [Planctomycetota bacterium]
MESLPSIPRSREDDFTPELVAERRRLAERAAGRELPLLGGRPVAFEEARGNVENLVGFVQVPVGLAGPLLVDTTAGQREVYVPLATTEGAMVASYSRGMAWMRAAGGATARVVHEGLSQHPVLVFDSVLEAIAAAEVALGLADELVALVAGITSHGALVEVDPRPLGRRLVLRLRFTTGDAIGINMAARGADLCSALVAERTGARARYVHGQDVEKRAHAHGQQQGRGRAVTAEVVIPRGLLAQKARCSPEDLVAILETYRVGYAELGTQNQLVQSANGLVALFLACGQDPAYVTESCNGQLDFAVTPSGDLHASVWMPSMLVGTVGGGSGQGTAAECLEVLGCRGSGHGNTFAELAAATVLAGDLSLMAAFCSHEFVAAHESLGRNRPGGA